MSDISLTGAKILFPKLSELATQIRNGTEALIEWDNFEAFGKIIWAKRSDSHADAGLHFDACITPQALIATRDLQDEFQARGGYREHERSSVRAWVNGEI